MLPEKLNSDEIDALENVVNNKIENSCSVVDCELENADEILHEIREVHMNLEHNLYVLFIGYLFKESYNKKLNSRNQRLD